MHQYSESFVGSTFGTWTVVALDFMPSRIGKKKHAYLCRCSCGAMRRIRGFEIDRGTRNKCQRCRIEYANKSGAYSKLYRVWGGMRERCMCQTHSSWCNYGGRGIAIHEEWSSFDVFKKWAIENGYSNGLEIDRIDNDGPYSPDNCRWTTALVNANNKRNNVIMEAFGESRTLSEWSRDPRCQVSYQTLWERLRVYGMDIETAITKPNRQKNGVSHGRSRSKAVVH